MTRAELFEAPSGEVAAGPSHPRFRRPMTGTNWRRARWGHSRPPTSPPPRARSVTQGVVENGYALVFSVLSPPPPG
jgi:hypothetical protein